MSVDIDSIRAEFTLAVPVNRENGLVLSKKVIDDMNGFSGD